MKSFGHHLLLSAILSLVLFAPSQAQQVDISGYVKAEAAYDTRQVLQVREGQLHLYPLPDSPVHAGDNLLLNAFQSRLAVTGSGTEALGAAVSGVVEADFFGVSNADVNGLRLRHAFVKLAWERHEVLAGQYWSPLFSPAVIAGVQGGNAGAPFQPFARFTQVRYTWKPGPVRIVGALSQQRDAFSSIGGSKAQQQSGLPGAHLHAEYHSTAGHLVGIGSYAKALRPVPEEARMRAWAVQGYGLLKAGPITARAKATYGSDLTDHLMTGGYVRTLLGDYETLRVASGWIDLTLGRGVVQSGLFAGVTRNLGAAADISAPNEAAGKHDEAAVTVGGVSVLAAHTRAAEIDNVWRLAPRLVYTSGNLCLSAELEVTSALYTSSAGSDLRPSRSDGDSPVVNARTLLSAFYYF